MHKFLLFSVCMALALCSSSQGTYIPLGSDAYNYIQRFDVKYSKILPIEHVADKPYFRSKVAGVAEALMLSNLVFDPVQKYQLQWLADENAEWLDSIKSFNHRHPNWKLFQEPATFARVNSKPKGLFDIRFNPMLEFHTGAETQGSRFLFSRAVGVEVRGNIKRVFNFYFNVTGNSARLPEYVTNSTQNAVYNDYHAFVPGEGYFKTYASGVFGYKDAVDYFDARGYVNANILKYINLTFGRDKNFIGDGIRSLFLSDNSAPYLFLKFNLDISRFHYEIIYAQLTGEYIRGADQLLPQKYMAVHHLDVEATHWLNVGLFESEVFSPFEPQYLNPIMFYKAVEAALGNADKEQIGADFKVNAARHLSFYGQFLLDEFNFEHLVHHDGWWGNKYGIQFGMKYIDILPHLDGQLEFNIVRPYVYTHEDTIDNYTNYNQPLAHPLGANFYEFIVNLHFQPLPRLSFNLKYFYARLGDDTLLPNKTLTNFGTDIFQATGASAQSVNSILGNSIGQGAKGGISYFQFLVNYELFHNMFLDADITIRTRTSTQSINNPTPTGTSAIFQFGGRWNIPYKNYMF